MRPFELRSLTRRPRTFYQFWTLDFLGSDPPTLLTHTNMHISSLIHTLRHSLHLLYPRRSQAIRR